MPTLPGIIPMPFADINLDHVMTLVETRNMGVLQTWRRVVTEVALQPLANT
jgi:hypothetical protein